MDRISELPTFIIHHIMSYLPAEEVARTSILSKRWNQLRISFPILEFRNPYFNDWKLGKEEFIELVDASLLRFRELNLCIQKLKLSVYTDHDDDGIVSSQLVDKWIGLAVENGVKELDIDVEIFGDNEYTLPQTIFSSKFLITLTLKACRLEEPSSAISLNSLKKLTLEGVFVSEQMLQKLIAECRLLEDLCLSRCEGWKFLSVSNTHKLRKMIIHMGRSKERKSVEIFVPSLQQLTFDSYSFNRTLINVAVSPHLKELSLYGLGVGKDRWFQGLISKFPMLEDLSVIACPSLKRFKISSTRLKHLQFQACDHLKAVDVDTPNLLSFTYAYNSIPTISMNAPCPWEAFSLHRGELDKRFYRRLKQFLGAANRIENLTIFLAEWIQNKVSYNLENFRKHSPSLPVPVEKMELSMQGSESNYQILLDGLFLICYPKTLCVWSRSDTERRFIVWLFEQLRNRDVKCCNSHRIKCWRHYLKDVKIEESPPYDEDCKLTINRLREHPKEFLRRPRGDFTLNLEWDFRDELRDVDDKCMKIRTSSLEDKKIHYRTENIYATRQNFFYPLIIFVLIVVLISVTNIIIL